MKNKPEDNERKFFQDRFEDFASEPDDAVWRKIADELPPPATGSFFAGKRLLLAVGVVLVGIAGLVWWLGAGHPANPQPLGSSRENNTESHAPNASQPTKTSSLRSTQPTAPSHRTDDTLTEPALTNEPTVSVQKTVPVQKATRGNASKTTPRLWDEVTEVQHTQSKLSAQNKVDAQQSRNGLPAISHQFSNQSDANYSADKSVTTGNPLADVTSVQPEPSRQLFSSRVARQAQKNSILENLKSRPVLVQESKMPAKPLVFNPLNWKPDIKPQKQKSSKPWSLYVNFTHWMNYYAITPIVTDSVLVNQVALGKTLSSQRSGWQWQAGLVYPLTERLQLRTGLFYYSQKQQILYQVQELYPQTSTVTQTSTDAVSVKHTYHKEMQSIENQQQNIGLRLDALYTLAQGGVFRHYTSVGMQAAWARSGQRTSYLNTDVQVGYGVARRLSHRLEFWIEPTFRYSLNNRLDQTGYTRTRPYYFGISAGLNLHRKSLPPGR